MAAEGQNGSKMLDEMSEYRIFELLKKYHYTLTTAESATGGMIASTLINVPGIAAFVTEGYVTYSNEAKVKIDVYKRQTEQDITKMCDQLDHSMGSYMSYFQILCILLSEVLILSLIHI